MPSNNMPPSFAERRALVKKLLDNNAPVAEFRRALAGANEEERAALYRILSPTRLMGKDYTYHPVALYAIGALTEKPSRAASLLRQFNRHTGWQDNIAQQAGRYFEMGLNERPDAWGLEFIDHYVQLAQGKIYFEIAHRFLRSRQLRCVSVGYLYAYKNYVIRDNSVSSRGFAPLLDIFNDDPLLLTQEFWDLFSNRVGDEFYVAPGATSKPLSCCFFCRSIMRGSVSACLRSALKGCWPQILTPMPQHTAPSTWVCSQTGKKSQGMPPNLSRCCALNHQP